MFGQSAVPSISESRWVSGPRPASWGDTVRKSSSTSPDGDELTREMRPGLGVDETSTDGTGQREKLSANRPRVGDGLEPPVSGHV